MYYFKNNGERIEKYQVNFSREKIERLKKEIIDRCSYIEHKEFISDYPPIFDDNSIIKNFHDTLVGKKEYFEETRDVYSYSYDEYKPPYLIELINRLINGDAEVIDEILTYDISSDESIDDKIKLVNQEFMDIEAENIDGKKAKLKELGDLLESKDLNRDQQNIEPYYYQLIKLIEFDLVDSLTIFELNRVESFLGIELGSNQMTSTSKNNGFVKILKKDKRPKL